MKPLNVTRNHGDGSRGNCLQTALACIFELPHADVPALEQLPPGQWRRELAMWAYSIGYSMVINHPSIPDSWFYIGVGLHQSGVRHAVVCQNGKMVHDTDPSNEGVESFEYTIAFEPMPAK